MIKINHSWLKLLWNHNILSGFDFKKWGVDSFLDDLVGGDFTGSGEVSDVLQSVIAESSVLSFKVIDWGFQAVELNVVGIILRIKFSFE